MVPGIGSVRFMNLVRYFGSAENVYESSKEELLKSGAVGEKLAQAIIDSKKSVNLSDYLKTLKENDVKVHTILESEYPANLKQIHDPPPVLYVKGELASQDQCTIGNVGSRKATDYGIRTSERLAERLAALGVTIASGLAIGIDSAAHRGAVRSGGRTIAVLGCGLKHVYPKSNTWLARDILKNGAIISEYPFHEEARPEYFPARNRLISGISLGVIVVEAGEKSGSLITADFALEQGREVFAVPGNITSPNSRGTNELIKNGAKLVSRIEDILEELNLQIIYEEKADTDSSTDKEIGLDEKKVLDSLRHAGGDIDLLVLRTGMTAAKVLTAITLLEMKGLIQQSGSFYYLN